MPSEKLLALLGELSHLPQLASLSIDCLSYFHDENSIYQAIFLLRKLTYCKLTSPVGGERVPLPFATKPSSILERLIINGHCHLEQLIAILSHTPNLRHLSCDHLYGSHLEKSQVPPLPERLTSVRLKVHNTPFDDFIWFLSKVGLRLQKLRVKQSNDERFFQARVWEELIQHSMSCLSLFDIQCIHYVQDGGSSSQPSIDAFSSAFWCDRRWSFDHHLFSFDDRVFLKFYSRLPYRFRHGSDENKPLLCSSLPRYENYSLYDRVDQDDWNTCISPAINFARHLTIEGRLRACEQTMQFPRVEKLKLQENHPEENPAFIDLVNSTVSLTQITELQIENEPLPHKQLLQLLTLAVNVHSLLLSNCPHLPQDQLRTLRPSLIHSKIRKLVIDDDFCQVHDLYWLSDIFPRLQCLEILIDEKGIEEVGRFLFSKSRRHSPKCLFSVLFFNMSDRAMYKLQRIIDEEHLVNDYTIQRVCAGWHLWW